MRLRGKRRLKGLSANEATKAPATSAPPSHDQLIPRTPKPRRKPKRSLQKAAAATSSAVSDGVRSGTKATAAAASSAVSGGVRSGRKVAAIAASSAAAASNAMQTTVSHAADEATAAAHVIQKHIRRVGINTIRLIIEAAEKSPENVERAGRLLERMGTPAARAIVSIFGLLEKVASKSSWVRAHRVTLIRIFTNSVRLVTAVLRLLLPRFIQRVRHGVEASVTKLHNRVGGIPLGEHGPLANYTVEVVRLDEQGKVWRRHRKSKAGEKAYYTRAHALRCLAAASADDPFGPRKVHLKGLIKSFTCRLKPQVVRPLVAGSAAASGHDVMEMGESSARIDLVKQRADEYLHESFPCFGKMLSRAIPRSLKTLLPFTLPENFMPRQLRDQPGEVVSIDVDLDVGMRTDSTEPLFDSSLGRFTSTSRVKNDARLAVELRGHNGWPSLGVVELKYLRVEARMMVWWDIFDHVLAFAFVRRDPPVVHWDIELALGPSCVHLPDILEDTLLSKVTSLVMRTFNRANPIIIKVNESDVLPDDDQNHEDDSDSDSSDDNEWDEEGDAIPDEEDGQGGIQIDFGNEAQAMLDDLKKSAV